MNKFIELILVIMGILLIELGFVSFVLITLLTTDYGFSEGRNSLLLVSGFLLLSIGTLLLFFITRKVEEIKQ